MVEAMATEAENDKKIKFYQDILQEERSSSMNLDYWIEYLDKFDIGHKLPLYDHQSLV